MFVTCVARRQSHTVDQRNVQHIEAGQQTEKIGEAPYVNEPAQPTTVSAAAKEQERYGNGRHTHPVP